MVKATLTPLASSASEALVDQLSPLPVCFAPCPVVFMYDRRSALALLCASSLPALAAPDRLLSDDGSPVRTFELARDKVAPRLGHAQRLGDDNADVTLVEWFDYNCGYCRQASAPLEEMLANDARLAALLVHFPILSAGSMQAAAVQRAVFRRDGAAQSADLHRALLSLRGATDLASAHALCSQLKITLPSQGDFDAAMADVAAMKKSAADLGLKSTPTFWIAGTAMIGWPGPRTIGAMVASARQCGRARCD